MEVLLKGCQARCRACLFKGRVLSKTRTCQQTPVKSSGFCKGSGGSSSSIICYYQGSVRATVGVTIQIAACRRHASNMFHQKKEGQLARNANWLQQVASLQTSDHEARRAMRMGPNKGPGGPCCTHAGLSMHMNSK